MEASQTDGQTKGDNAPSETQDQQTEQVRNPEAVLNKNRELLGINKKLSGRLAELESMVKATEQEKLSAQGKKDEVIESLRDEISQLKGKIKQKDEAYSWNTIESQVKQYAVKEGCVDPEKLIRLIDDVDFESLDVDSRFRINQDDLSRLVSKAKKDNHFLFDGQKADVDDLTPTTRIEKKKTKSLDDMSSEEIEAALRAYKE